MYAVRWDVETVIKWLAVGMVLGLLAMAVMPAIEGHQITWYLTEQYGPHGSAAGAVATWILAESGKRVGMWVGDRIGATIGFAAGGPVGAVVGTIVGLAIGGY